MTSIAQRTLDCLYASQQLSQNIAAAYWLASLESAQGFTWAQFRLIDAEKSLKEIATALGFRIERIENEVRPAPAPSDFDDSIPF